MGCKFRARGRLVPGIAAGELGLANAVTGFAG